MIRLGQTETTDFLTTRERRQVPLSLRLGAELEDRQHHERGLHAQHRPIAGIDALDLACEQAVGDVVQAATAIALGQRAPEQSQLAHLPEDPGVGALVPEGLEHARRETLLGVGARRVTNHALVHGQLRLEQQGIVPVKFNARHVQLLLAICAAASTKPSTSVREVRYEVTRRIETPASLLGPTPGAGQR